MTSTGATRRPPPTGPRKAVKATRPRPPTPPFTVHRPRSPFPSPHRLTGQEKSGQAATFAYDNNSNLTLKHHQGGSPKTLSYDPGDRITTIAEGAALTTMAYQSRGALHTQKTGADTTTFTYSDMMFLGGVNRGRLRVRGYSWVFPPVFPYTPRPRIIDLPRPSAGVLDDWPKPRPRSSHVKSR